MSFFAALAVPGRAQVRVEMSAPAGASSVRAVPAVTGQQPPISGLPSSFPAPALASPFTLQAPSAVVPPSAQPSASPSASPAATPAGVPAAPAQDSTTLVLTPVTHDPRSHPSTWDFTRWRETLPAEDASRWSFQTSWFRAARLFDGAFHAKPLGEGAMGSVFVHPTDSDKIVKVARAGYKDAAGEYFAPDDETVLAYEDYDLSRLAAVGAAPKTLARAAVSGRPASVRERVRGFTVDELKRRGAFGEREKALVHELLDRIADAGFTARDLNLGNIVIGRIRGTEERAWLVDTLGVSVRDDLDADGRKKEMLESAVPWIAVRGFGLGRPLAKALDAGPSLFTVSRTPVAWPRWKRWATLAGIVSALGLLPALAHAALPSPLSLGLGALPSWPAFAASAALIGLAGIPLRVFAHRLAPWVMTRSQDAGAEMLRRGPLSVVPELAIGAAVEELLFRAGSFLAGAMLLRAVLPLVPAVAAASFLSSMIFALIHGYGSVWTRVIGGMLYAGAFIASGSLLLPIAAHFAFNLSLYVYGRYLR